MADINIPITQEVLLLITEIDEFKGKWRALNALAVRILELTKEHGRVTTQGIEQVTN
jgi:hypothetical protein